jgi:hypothetical protein
MTVGFERHGCGLKAGKCRYIGLEDIVSSAGESMVYIYVLACATVEMQ